jgi:hypothetical protein
LHEADGDVGVLRPSIDVDLVRHLRYSTTALSVSTDTSG